MPFCLIKIVTHQPNKKLSALSVAIKSLVALVYGTSDSIDVNSYVSMLPLLYQESIVPLNVGNFSITINRRIKG